MAEAPTSAPSTVFLAPLAIKCTNTNCADDQHCYLATRKMVSERQVGGCRDCGARLVDWDRVHARDLADAAHTFAMMRTELIRHHFWHAEIDEKAVNHARRKGRRGMRAAAEQRVRTSVAAPVPVRDGRQTPMQGNTLFYAQHATASCCRRCIEEWHGIPRGRALSESEVQYLADLISLYVGERLPTLTEDGEYVPVVRRAPARPPAPGASSASAGAKPASPPATRRPRPRV